MNSILGNRSGCGTAGIGQGQASMVQALSNVREALLRLQQLSVLFDQPLNGGGGGGCAACAAECTEFVYLAREFERLEAVWERDGG
jgi:hypothetical protein